MNIENAGRYYCELVNCDVSKVWVYTQCLDVIYNIAIDLCTIFRSSRLRSEQWQTKKKEETKMNYMDKRKIKAGGGWKSLMFHSIFYSCAWYAESHDTT